MSSYIKRLFKRNTHNGFLKAIGRFGIAMNRFYENRNHDIYSNGELRIIKKLAGLNPSVIIDGGANIGSYSLLLNKYCSRAKIFSFEPVESTYEQLRKNICDYPNIIGVNKGLFSEDIKKQINIFPSHTHSSLFDIKGVPYNKIKTITVDLLRGSKYMDDNNIEYIDFLKLDLEGAEYDALKGFTKALEKQKIRLVQFEYGYINITTRKLLLDFYEFFSDYGYIIGKIFPKSVEFRPYKFKYEDFIGPNFIAIHKSDKSLKTLLIK